MNAPPSSSSLPIVRYLHLLEEGALVLLMGVLILLSFSQIVLRNLFAITLLWADPLIRHLVLWIGFIGALIATRQDRHIKIGALLRLCSPFTRQVLQALSDLFSTTICLLLTWISIRFVHNEMTYGTGSILTLPTWVLQLVFPLTFGGMSLRFLLQFGYRLLTLMQDRNR